MDIIIPILETEAQQDCHVCKVTQLVRQETGLATSEGDGYRHCLIVKESVEKCKTLVISAWGNGDRPP